MVLSASLWRHACYFSHGADSPKEFSERTDVEICRTRSTAIEQHKGRFCELRFPGGHEDHCKPPIS